MLNQTLENIEHILIDDGSTDGSGQILDEYREAHPDRQITVIHQPNSGVPAYEQGLERACGEYVAFLDNDDYLASNFCELLYSRAQAEDADICKGECITWDMNGKQRRHSSNDPIRRLRSKLCFQGFCWTAIYRTYMLREHGIHFEPHLWGYGQDLVFQHQAVLACSHLALDDGPCYFHWLREGSASLPAHGRSSRQVRQGISVYRNITASLYRHQTSLEPQGIGYVVAKLIVCMLSGASNVRHRNDAKHCVNCAHELWRGCPASARSFVSSTLQKNYPQAAAQLGIR